MTTFYLQQRQIGNLGGKLMIKDEMEFGYALLESIDAVEWLEAKRSFGYPLSPVQERLLETPLAQRLQDLKDRLGS